jgi:quinol monooxygenase YgiN
MNNTGDIIDYDMKEKHFTIKTFLFIVMILTVASAQSLAQQQTRKIRIAKIEVYSEYLEEYRIALAEHAKTAVREEPGVLTLQAVYDKAHPTQVWVFEVYSSDSAYQAHLKTSHFLKYKSGTLKMVKSLELIEVAPIAMEIKPELIQKRN